MKGRLSQLCETSTDISKEGALTLDLDPKHTLRKPVQTIYINLKDKKKTRALD